MKGAPVDENGLNSDANTRTAESIADAPLPTRATLRMRQNMLVQSWRFTHFTLRMTRIILRGHR